MTNTPQLFILGSSGHAREIAAYALVVSPTRRIVFVDDTDSTRDCISQAEYLRRLGTEGGESIMGAGRCEVRESLLEQIRPPFATIIYPTATILGEIAPGCALAPGAIIAPNARLEAHVMVNYNATIGHDALVRSLTVVGPGAAIGGWCRIDLAVYIGAGALIRERLSVASRAVIGLGAVVTRDVPAAMIAVGVPAVFKDKTSSGGGWLK